MISEAIPTFLYTDCDIGNASLDYISKKRLLTAAADIALSKSTLEGKASSAKKGSVIYFIFNQDAHS